MGFATSSEGPRLVRIAVPCPQTRVARGGSGGGGGGGGIAGVAIPPPPQKILSSPSHLHTRLTINSLVQ